MSTYNGLKDDKDTTNYEINVIINIKDEILFEKVSNMIYFNLAGLDEYINSDIVLNIDDGENIILLVSGDCNRIPHFINTICY